MKNKTITVILCEGKIVNQQSEHEISPVRIVFPVKAGPSEAYLKLLGCTKLERDTVKIHGATYTLYYDKNNRNHDELIATYPVRDEKDKIFDVIAGSVLIAKEDESHLSFDIPKDEQLFIADYLSEQTELAGMAVVFGKV